MATKTIGVREEVYERLAAEKREGESFSDALARVLDAVDADWRASFGRYAEEGDELAEIVSAQRDALGEGLDGRQRSVGVERGDDRDADTDADPAGGDTTDGADA